MLRHWASTVLLLSLTSVSHAFNSSTDLMSLHYDHAPDRDDGHAAVAGLIVSRHYGLSPHVIGGAYGDKNRDRYDAGSEAVMNSAWQNNWLNAHRNWTGTVSQTVNRWTSTLAAGGDVWVAEGGQSDLTADVVRQLQQAGYNTRSRVHVVQHSGWNEDHANAGDLAYVKSNTDYVRIDDGNNPNGTADLRSESGSAFVSVARSSNYAAQWNAAFAYLNPNEKVDFSDTVEMLHILGVGQNQVANVDDFARLYMSGAATPDTPTSNDTTTPDTGATSGASFVAIRVEAESHDTNAGWSLTSNNVLPNIQPDPDPSHAGSASSGGYLELLPDTRVTHSDPLTTGTNFWDTAGTGPSIDYYLSIPETGRYLVYVKAYSTGSEDNGIHVGLNGSNPASGQRIQWCDGKHQWTWSSAQRTSSNHCGTPKTIYLDITNTGLNRITFSAREDGFEFDQFLLLKEKHGGSQNCYPLSNDQIRCTNSNGGVISDTYIPLSNSDSTQTTTDQPNNQNDTQINSGTNTCSSSESDSDNDGWGFENGQSCRVTAISNDTTNPPASDQPTCSTSASDSDNDGWGWENGQSCIVGAGAGSPNNNNGSAPTCSSFSVDSDGDGWGWENGRSCITFGAAGSGGTPTCSSAAVDSDGDGWGWENQASCRVR